MKQTLIDPLAAVRARPLGIKTLVLNPGAGWARRETWEPFATFPSEIFACKNLEHLEFCNAFEEKSTVTLPAELGGLTKLKSLRLFGVPLKALPETIGKLKALETLLITNAHQLSSLPTTLGSLTKLRELQLSGDGDGAKLTKIPDEIGELSRLEELVLPSGKVRDVPASIFRLSSLRRLVLPEGTKKLPPGIGRLTKLESLRIPMAALASIAKELPSLKNLRALTLTGRGAKLPVELGELRGLRELVAVGVGLKELPSSLANLRELTRLYVGGNELTRLSDVLASLPKLEDVTFKGNAFPKDEQGLLDKMKTAAPSQRAKLLLAVSGAPKKTSVPKKKRAAKPRAGSRSAG